jgi:hypothetical protein
MCGRCLFQAARLLADPIAGRLSGQAIARLRELVGTSDDHDDDLGLLLTIKSAPGSVSLASMLTEIDKLTYRTDGKGRRRVVRTIYEIRTFEALCDQLRCKGIWVAGAGEFRNPDEDLVTDFAERRAEHYAELRKPLDPQAFVAGLQDQLSQEQRALNDAVPGLGGWLEIAPRGRHGAIRLTPQEAAPEPANPSRLKKAIGHRWGTLRLIDVLKEAVLRSGCSRSSTCAVGPGGAPHGR